MDAHKREAALVAIKKELDEAVAANKKIVGIRINIWTLGCLFEDKISLIDECSVKPRGDKDWPPGAIMALGGSYGANSFMFLDNSLPDSEMDIDYEKK